MKFIVLHNQSLFDVALQHSGTIESIFELALANSISITDDLASGSWLIANSQEVDKDILNYYQAKNIQPATAFSQKDKELTEKPEGISIWAINLDFIVSN